MFVLPGRQGLDALPVFFCALWHHSSPDGAAICIMLKVRPADNEQSTRARPAL